LDESLAQTKRIHKEQRMLKTLNGLKKEECKMNLSVKHQNIQRVLQPVKIVNPYAHHLDFPPKFLRTRRDNLRFLNLIEVITFLHQYQRPKRKYHGLEYIESSVRDYELAYELAKELFSHSLDELTQGSRQLLGHIGHMAKEKQASFTRRHLSEWTGLSYYQIKAHIRQLEELGYIELLEKKRGQKHIYRYSPSSNGSNPLKCLIAPSRLKRLVGHGAKAPPTG